VIRPWKVSKTLESFLEISKKRGPLTDFDDILKEGPWMNYKSISDLNFQRNLKFPSILAILESFQNY
jgi:hypothetical protein